MSRLMKAVTTLVMILSVGCGDTVSTTGTGDEQQAPVGDLGPENSVEEPAVIVPAATEPTPTIPDPTPTTQTDTTAPTILSSIPANNAANVAVNSAVSVTFSEAMDTASFTATNVIVSPVVAGAISLSGNTVTFTPAAVLAQGTTFSVRFTTGVRDVAGNGLAADYIFSFTTLDTTPPTVVSSSPLTGTSNFPRNAVLSVTFNEAILPASANAMNVTLVGPSGPVDGAVGVNGATVTFTPAVLLPYFIDYTFTVGTGITDMSGNALAAEHGITFRSIGDSSFPWLASASPGYQTINNPINSVITINFTEAMDPLQLTTDYIYINHFPPVAVTLTTDGTNVTLTPTAPLDYDTDYEVVISGELRDLDGNMMYHGYEILFRTAPAPAAN